MLHVPLYGATRLSMESRSNVTVSLIPYLNIDKNYCVLEIDYGSKFKVNLNCKIAKLLFIEYSLWKIFLK